MRERPKDVKGTVKRLLHYLSAYKIRLVLVLIMILISSAANVASGYFLRPLINNYIVPLIGQQNPDLSGFIGLLAVMATIYLLGVVSVFFQARIMTIISTGMLLNIRKDMFRHMQDLPIRYFDQRTHGEIMSLYTNDIDTLREMLAQGLPQIITSFISLTGTLVVMIILSPILTGVSLLMLIPVFLVIKTLGAHSANFFIKQQRSLSKVNGFIEEMVEGQKEVKVFCREEKVKAGFDERAEDLRYTASSAHTFASILMPILANISYISYAICAALGGVLVIHSMLDIGSLGSFLSYNRQFFMPITQTSQQFNNFLSALAGAERIFTMIEQPVEVDEGKVHLVYAEVAEDGTITEKDSYTGHWAWKKKEEDGSFSYRLLAGDVRFENVTFGYEPKKTVLHDISMYAKPGQKIAFVGSTGAGKTTITNLFVRFYDVEQGRILYDGIDVKDIAKADLRRSVAMVLQDTHLFTGTVMENIRYGNLNATDEEVIEAAKLANAHPFIMHLKDGYQTMLTGDGANISQGQRQLLGIARAAVANPPVLVLDEATSSVDTRTEALIEKGMDKLMEGRTVFVIAHRLSTIRNAKAIMVLENGEILERGDHDSLMADKGRYYQLYTGMFELD